MLPALRLRGPGPPGHPAEAPAEFPPNSPDVIHELDRAAGMTLRMMARWEMTNDVRGFRRRDGLHDPPGVATAPG